MGTAKAWIAIGDRVYGILFAAGGVVVGCISMGGAAVGVIAMGGAAMGLLAFGGFALGGLALGGGAIGMLAAGGVAMGWISAEGGLAVACEFFGQFPWMDMTNARTRTWFTTICWLPMLLFALQWLRMQKRRRNVAR